MPLPIFAALTKALPYITTAWSLYAQSRQKPKKADYVPRGAMYERYINYLKSKTVESTVYHQRMRPELRRISAQTRRGQRQVGYQVARDKPGGGIEAQMRMGINRQALEAIGIASEKASIAQEQVNVRTGEQLLRIGVQEEFALQRYQRAKQRFTQQMFTSTVQAGLGLANIAVRQHMADAKVAAAAAKDAATAEQAIVKAYENAKAVGDFVGDLAAFKEGMDIADYTDPTAMGKYLATIRKQKTEDIKFQKGERKEALLASSTQAATQAYKLIADRPEGALEMLEETGYFRYMTDKDILAVTKKAIAEAPKPIDPLDLEITMKSVTHDLKGLKNLLPKAVESGDIKRIEKVYKAYDVELNAAMDRVEEGDEAKMKELTIRKAISQIQFISGMYKSTYPNYKPGKKTEGEKFFNDAMATLEGIKAKKGIASHEYNSVMKDYRNYLLTLDTDKMLGGAEVLAAIFSGNVDAVSALLGADETTVGINAKQVASLYIQFSSRMDALVKGSLYEGAIDVLNSLY